VVKTKLRVLVGVAMAIIVSVLFLLAGRWFGGEAQKVSLAGASVWLRSFHGLVTSEALLVLSVYGGGELEAFLDKAGKNRAGCVSWLLDGKKDGLAATFLHAQGLPAGKGADRIEEIRLVF
jgi:hypothetical protein